MFGCFQLIQGKQRGGGFDKRKEGSMVKGEDLHEPELI